MFSILDQDLGQLILVKKFAHHLGATSSAAFRRNFGSQLETVMLGKDQRCSAGHLPALME
jgi:hypothetical protein